MGQAPTRTLEFFCFFVCVFCVVFMFQNVSKKMDRGLGGFGQSSISINKTSIAPIADRAQMRTNP